MDATEPVVRTAAGQVRGRAENGIAVFRGIPFAQPPVGDLRFAAPRPAPPGSGENTLTVSQSSGSAPGATDAVGPSMNADCGGGGPNMSASRTPSHGRAGCGAANRRVPTGGWANGMPRKTATPFSARPRTCPAAVRTTGSVTSIRTPSG